MSSAKKLLEAAAGNAAAGGGATDISDVFSTYLYTGNGGTQTINNGIDLTGEGGLTWIKDRTYGNNHFLWDTERGVQKGLITSTNFAEQSEPNGLTAFNSNGFAVGGSSGVNPNTYKMASWTFLKAKKFFDCVTYTGNGVAGKTVSHNLGSVPGMIIIKQTNTSRDWVVYHRGLNGGADRGDYVCRLNTAAAQQANIGFLNDTEPTDSVFSLGTSATTNQNGGTYVAYLFAHETDDDSIIQCGSYTGNGSTTGPVINVGWEPQWVLVKKSSDSDDWYIFDSIRGFVTGSNDQALSPNTSSTEGSTTYASLTATGWSIDTSAGALNQNGETFIYVAIRAPMATEPAAATEVFAISTAATSTAQAANPPVQYYAGFPVDMMLKGSAFDGSGANYTHVRLTNGRLRTDSTAVETVVANYFDTNQGYRPYTGNADPYFIAYLFKRAKNYFDVVAYTGTGSNRTVAHSLGVVPEMMWVKGRNVSDHWHVYQKDITPDYYLILNDTGVPTDSATIWNDTSPTSSVFTVGTNGGVNGSNSYYIAYLFATLAGVSKVGSVTHSGSSTDVNCGFSNGARFVLLKRTDSSTNGNWYYWDTLRGIVAGNDPYLLLNSNAAQVAYTDYIDPLSSGFTITGNFTDGDYIFYAIA